MGNEQTERALALFERFVCAQERIAHAADIGLQISHASLETQRALTASSVGLQDLLASTGAAGADSEE